jgi:hypothetical protein
VDEIRTALASWYPYLKAVHVIAAALWSFSTAVAWVFYLEPRSGVRPRARRP